MTIPFDAAKFKLDYLQFSNVSDNKLTNTWTYSACVLGQVVSSLFQEDETKYYWLTIVLAHILTCEQNGLTGRPDNVSQGSESVSFDFDSPAWSIYWAQTPYGQQIYQCVAMYLNGGHYISNGEIPYLSNSMSGINELQSYGW